MADYHAIYAHDADRYDRLVSAEDVDRRVPGALGEMLGVEARRVVDIGCGTGRVTRAILEVVHPAPEIIGVEPHEDMLRVARERTSRVGVEFRLGSAEALPVETGWADAAVAGWVFGHQCAWAGAAWPERIGVMLAEMRRVVRPGGVLVIAETLGTGLGPDAPPQAPTPGLAAYYEWLEREHGFARRELATDYDFASAAEAEAVLGFFFGERLVTAIRTHGWSRVPEHTGLWSRRV